MTSTQFPPQAGGVYTFQGQTVTVLKVEKKKHYRIFAQNESGDGLIVGGKAWAEEAVAA